MNDDPYNEPVYTIGLAAEKLGIAVPTLRMYEQAGLVIPYKTESKRRLYSRNDLKRIELIMELIREQGMNLAGIRLLCSIVPCWILTNCPKDMFENCNSFINCSLPCWLNDEIECSKDNDCRLCHVYQSCSDHLKNPKTFLSKFYSTQKK